MPKKSQLVVLAENGLATIKMTGLISDWKADLFEMEIDALIQKGVSKGKVFIDSIGGDAISANRIATILDKFPGILDCEIGSICASSATYITSKCKVKGGVITGAKNTQFMVHKPYGVQGGNEDELKGNLKLVQNLTKQFRKTYAECCEKTEEEIEELWKSGDCWMDAEEAKAYGFISAVEGEADVDPEIVEQLKVLGCPKLPEVKASQQPSTTNNTDMSKIPLILAALNLPEGHGEAEILAEVKRITAKAAKLESEVTELKDQIKTSEEEKVKSLVDAAIKEGKLTEAERARYEKLAKSDYAEVSAMLAEKKPHVPLTTQVGANNTAQVNGSVDLYAGWNFEKFQKDAPAVLATMREKEPERFKALLDDFKARNPVNR